MTLWTLTRVLCPWGSPGKNSGVGCHAHLQGIFLTQGIEPECLVSSALADGFFTTKHHLGRHILVLQYFKTLIFCASSMFSLQSILHTIISLIFKKYKFDHGVSRITFIILIKIKYNSYQDKVYFLPK